jgi:competence protein ComEC
MKAPILLCTCFFAAGIMLVHHSRLPLLLSLIACGVCELAGLLLWYRKWETAPALLALAGFTFAGASAATLFAYRFPPNDLSHLTDEAIGLNQPLQVQGVLGTDPLRTPSGLQFDLNARRVWIRGKVCSVSGKIRLRVLNRRKSAVGGAERKLRYGDTIIARERLKRPENYANPGSFDYREWLESVQDIGWEGTVEGSSSLREVNGTAPPAFQSLIESLRQELTASIDRLYPPWTLSGRNGSVLKAVLLGDRSSLDSDTIENFRRTGLYHLLVVAGLHVGLLAMLAEILLRLLGIRATWRAATLMVLLVFYVSLVEQRAPTLRASLMIGAYLFARLLDREQPTLNAVGLAALILLFNRPGWLLDAGFQLSFAAALLIAGLALPVLERTTEPYRRALRHLEEPSLDRELAPRLAQFRLDLRDASDWLTQQSPFLEGRLLLVTKLVTAPVKAGVWLIDLLLFSAVLQAGLILPMTEIFHRVTLAGIGLNVLAVPCMTILLAVAVPTVILNALLPGLAVLPGKLLSAILNGLFALTEFPQMPHWLSYRVPTPPAWVAWGFVFWLVIGGCAFPLSRRVLAISAVGATVLAILICMQPFPPRIPSGVLEVTSLDCGGGEALFIVLPNRTTILVGACGGGRAVQGGDPLRARRWDPGENIVSPYLWSRGIKTVDVFLVPDIQGDHLAGVASVLRNFHVKEFWSGPLPSAAYSAGLLDLLHRSGVRFLRLSGDQTISESDISATVVWPPTGEGADAGSSSDTPLIIRIPTQQGSVLLAQDLPSTDLNGKMESDFVTRPEVLAMSDGTHLEREVAGFAAKTRPSIALVGSMKEYGRQSENDSLQQAQQGRDFRVLSVALNGAITVQIHNGTISLNCFNGPCR